MMTWLLVLSISFLLRCSYLAEEMQATLPAWKLGHLILKIHADATSRNGLQVSISCVSHVAQTL